MSITPNRRPFYYCETCEQRVTWIQRDSEHKHCSSCGTEVDLPPPPQPKAPTKKPKKKKNGGAKNGV